MTTGQLRDYPVNRNNFIYHRDIGFPKSINLLQGFTHLRYTNHAAERQADKYDGLKVLPSTLNINWKNIVEIHTDDNVFVKKILVRIHYDKHRDMVLAIQPLEKYAKVITFWLNKKKDQHTHLDKTKYTHP